MVNVNGELALGRWQAFGKTEKVALNPLIDISLPFLALGNPNNSTAANLNNLNNLKSKIENLKSLGGQLAGEFKAQGNLDNLTASGINIGGNGKLSIADSNINLKGELVDGKWQGIAETDRTSVSSLVDLGLPLLDVGLAFTADTPQTVANINNLKSKIQNIKSINGQLSSQFQFQGNLDNLTANNINVGGSGKLNIGAGNVNFQGELVAGNWQGIAETDRTSISSLVDLGLPFFDIASTFITDNQQIGNLNNLKSKIPWLSSYLNCPPLEIGR